MKYTKEDFGRDLFFYIGFLDAALEEHNKHARNKINMVRFEQFVEYCNDRFSTKKGVIKG